MIEHIIQTTSEYKRCWQVAAHDTLHVIFEQRCSALSIADITVILEPHAQLQLMLILLAGEVGELHINVLLAESAQVIVKGAYALNGTQKNIIRVTQHHQGKGSVSHVTINGVVAAASMIDYAGIIIVDEQASKSVASQENKTIVWSSSAKAQSIPSLEVKTNDVQCAHGSAIGYLNKEHIWYAQTRGMSILHAQKLLLNSFFCQTLPDSIEDKIVNELVHKIIG